MASSALQKLLRNQSQSASKIVAHIRQPQPPLHPFVLTRISQIVNPVDVLPSPDHPRTDSLKPNHSFCGQVYPSFSFEFFLNQVAPPGLVRREPDEETAVEADDSSVIRADSVKKKRKRKMNKHKLRKLRKRLQRKTKA